MTQDHQEKSPPPGFVQSHTRGPFSTHNGPFFHKVEGDQFWHGLYIAERHCNSRGRLHGGMMTTFADGLMATAVARANKITAVTISLNCDICSAADIGDWLEGTARQIGLNDGIAYVEAEAWVGGKTIFTASGVFRLLEGKAARKN
ncbi:PaaI family thioesterase [Sneathiella sp. CAU 1612]|uniref:PaaI family thioesterase n=1 Tax=Sneathiella sedimenti TaxID=2816034 RepID=A0ABS3F227_9PROT|nr:PaaI family thioesterase [Sneathiella sedimenti]MBO0332500.1 PaaI family thioesterase [Sneathiella sedimenti]